MQIQPLAGSSLSNIAKLLIINRGIDLEYVPKLMGVSLISLAGVSSRWLERIKFGHAIETLNIHPAPIFILGHWRSGTTYLHNLISQDQDLGYLSTYQAYTPEQSLIYQPISRWLLKQLLPQTRPMDNIELSVDSPQEEEFALANLSPYSYYHGWSFPRKLQQYFSETVLFEGPDPTLRAEWQKTYRKLINIATLATQGKQLILKNPANTARVKALLELFPNAKFVHIYRNPYFVYLSTRRLYQKVIPIHTFQKYSEAEIEANILLFYEQLMQRFFEEKALIPVENLLEFSYEAFETDPMHYLECIYKQFDLPNFERSRSTFEQYINAQRHYRKNRFSIDPATLDQISQRWKFAIDRWNYSVPEELQSPCPLPKH